MNVKEMLKKMLQSITKAAKLLKEEKTEEAVAELETATAEVTDETIDGLDTPEVVETPAVLEPTTEELEKSSKNEKILKAFGDMDEKAFESLKKRAYLSIDAAELGELFGQLLEVKDQMSSTSITKLFEDVKTLNGITLKKQDESEIEKKSSFADIMNPTA